jgi:predicted enzyme related to lactoylglutathione lyase
VKVIAPATSRRANPQKEGRCQYGGSLKPGVAAPCGLQALISFYAESLGLHIYREWGSGPSRGAVFFLGGGFLELSGTSRTTASENTWLWLQVRDVNAVGREFGDAGVEIIEPPTDKPWGLREMQIRDPDGLRIVIVEVPENHPLRRR